MSTDSSPSVREVRAAGRFAFRGGPDIQALFRVPRREVRAPASSGPD